MTIIANLFKILCSYDFHAWKYSIEKHKIIGDGITTTLDVKIRQCQKCDKRQHHMMPIGNGRMIHWRNASFKEGDVINLIPINDELF